MIVFNDFLIDRRVDTVHLNIKTADREAGSDSMMFTSGGLGEG